MHSYMHTCFQAVNLKENIQERIQESIQDMFLRTEKRIIIEQRIICNRDNDKLLDC